MTYIPLIIEKSSKGEVSYDIFSRLLKERIILLNAEITDDTANLWIAELLYLASVSDETIYIYINSPGGSITAGLALYDTMQYIKPKIITICVGMAASMAAFILSSGNRRYALENSEIMIHEPSTKITGNATDIFNHTKWLERIKTKVDAILAKNTNHTIEEIKIATLKDNFMSAIDAKEFNIIDEILRNNPNKLERK
jgi:ATP-dependent Clp protease protease subunit